MYLYVEPTVDTDLAELVAFLRDDDREEAEAMAGSKDLLTPLLDEFHRGVAHFHSVFSAESNKLLAVGGYDNTGRVWFMMTKEPMPFAVRREFLQVLQMFKVKALKLAPLIWNQVLVSNTEHIRLLEYLGATFGDYELLNGRIFKTFNIGGDLWE